MLNIMTAFAFVYVVSRGSTIVIFVTLLKRYELTRTYDFEFNGRMLSIYCKNKCLLYSTIFTFFDNFLFLIINLFGTSWMRGFMLNISYFKKTLVLLFIGKNFLIRLYIRFYLFIVVSHLCAHETLYSEET